VYIETVVKAIYHLHNVHHDDTGTQRNFNGVWVKNKYISVL